MPFTALGQPGAGFSQRLRRAVSAMERDVDIRVIVGTDTPGLDSRHVRAALDTLRREPSALVLGPARDGGVYLLAARGPIDELLAAARWCSRATHESLERAAAAQGRPVFLLEPLADLDRPRDLVHVLAGPARRSWKSLVQALSRLLVDIARPRLGPKAAFPHAVAVRVSAGRAPPRLAG